MSQPEAALYIQPPTLETRVAVQITANAAWRNGATKTADLPEVAPVAVLIAGPNKQKREKLYSLASQRGSKSGAVACDEREIPALIAGNEFALGRMSAFGGKADITRRCSDVRF